MAWLTTRPHSGGACDPDDLGDNIRSFSYVLVCKDTNPITPPTPEKHLFTHLAS